MLSNKDAKGTRQRTNNYHLSASDFHTTKMLDNNAFEDDDEYDQEITPDNQ